MKWCTCLCFISPTLSPSLHPALRLPIQGPELIDVVSHMHSGTLTRFITRTHTEAWLHLEVTKVTNAPSWLYAISLFLTECLAFSDNLTMCASGLFRNPLVESSSWGMPSSKICFSCEGNNTNITMSNTVFLHSYYEVWLSCWHVLLRYVLYGSIGSGDLFQLYADENNCFYSNTV